MSTPHKFRTNAEIFGRSRTASVQGVRPSVRFAHLPHMKTIISPTAPGAAPGTAAATGPARPVETEPADHLGMGGAFEPALSLKELAAQLHVSVQTLYDLRSQGRGPTGFRVGRHLRFRQSEIEAWLLRMEDEDLERHPNGSRR
jgi:excisionase family DNA binding protein